MRRAPPTSNRRLAEQLFDAIDQNRDQKRLNQILDLVLVEEKRDMGIGRKTSNENETIRQGRPNLLCLQIKFVSAQLRHFQIADHHVVFVSLDLHHRFLAVERDIHQEILVSEDPLERGGELFVVVHDEDSLELKTVDDGLHFVRERVKFSHETGTA